MKDSLLVWIVLIVAVRVCISHTQSACTVSSFFTAKPDYLKKESIYDSILPPKPRRRDLKLTKYSTRFMLDLFNILNQHSEKTSRRPKRGSNPSENQLSEDEIHLAEISDDIISMSCINKKSDIVGQKQKLVFSMQEVSDNVRVLKAELKLYQKRIPTPTSYLLKVIYRTSKKTKKVVKENIAADFTGWISMDVSKIFKSWLKYRKDNQTLYVTAQRDQKNTHPAHMGIIFQNQGNGPFLLAFLQSNEANNRLPRYLLPHKTKNRSYKDIATYGKCTVRPMEVSFKELGWQEWVIAPDKYTSGFCEGSCDFPLKSPIQATNHAIIQSMMALKYPDQIPKPSCAPSEAASLSILFNVDSNTILKTYRQMIVISCSCQ